MCKIISQYLLCLFALFITANDVEAKETIRSSVSPEFRNGLQEKYLQYLADKLSMDLKIYPMPYSRRIRALKKGEIDIMVGISSSLQESNEIYKLSPAYEQIQSQYFVRNEDASNFSKEEDLQQLVVGMTINKQETYKKLEQEHEETVYVSTLEQKVELLVLGRIDAFLHFKQSAQRLIEQKGLKDKIRVLPFQGGVKDHYHFGISTQSPFYQHREMFEAVIKQGVESQDFQRIRMAHYQKSSQLE